MRENNKLDIGFPPFLIFFLISFTFFFCLINYCIGDLCLSISYFRLGGEENKIILKVFWYYFAHDGITHFLENMVVFFLFFFYFEKELNGTFPLIIFILTAILSGLIYIYFDPCSEKISVVGGSGGINGLIGSFLLFKTEKKIKFIPFLNHIFRNGIPSLWIKILILLWLFYNIYSLQKRTSCEGLSYSIHVYGFVIGIIASAIYRIKIKYS